MAVRSLLFSVLIIMYHLQATADDTLIVSGSRALPIITTIIDKEQAARLKKRFPETAENFLSLHLVTNNVPEQSAVQGKYQLNKDRLSFIPLYPLGAGLEFEIWYSTANNTSRRRYYTERPGTEWSPARAIEVYPTTDTIPENILAFHIRFSHPIYADQKAYTQVNVYKENDQLIDRVWRQRSFWLDSNRLLILMIHPGRVKSGIHYIGPAFEKGNRYRLELNGYLKDKNGSMALLNIKKVFVVGDEDRRTPSVREVSVKKRKTQSEVQLLFSESMDIGTVTEGLKVTDKDGNIISCDIHPSENDKTFLILPRIKWSKGEYKISLHKNVCDLAANRISRPFELTRVSQKEDEPDFIRLSFEIN